MAKTPRLVALTSDARLSLGGKTEVRLTRFPFRIGRESRMPGTVARVLTTIDRRILNRATTTNDLYLLDFSATPFISREHCAIVREGDAYRLVDRNSKCGTAVGDVLVGGDGDAGPVPLQNGDTIMIGGRDAPYLFLFELETD